MRPDPNRREALDARADMTSDDANDGPSAATESPDAAGQARFGIKEKLFATFAGLAALTAIASAVIWVVFGDIDRSVTRVTEESLPGIVNALALAEKSNEIAIAVPALMAARSQEERVAELVLLKQRSVHLADLVAALDGQRVDEAQIDRLLDLQERLTDRLLALNAIIERRLDLQAQRRERLARLAAAHDAFLRDIEPLIDDAVFDLVITGEQVTAQSTEALTELVGGGITQVDRLLTLMAEANLAAGLLSEALHVDDPALIQPIRERFIAAAAAMDRSLRQLPAAIRDGPLAENNGALLRFGRGASNVFDRRQAMLREGTIPARLDGSGDAQLQAVKTAHQSLVATLTPLIDDAAFDVVMTTEEITRESRASITNLIDLGTRVLHSLLGLRAETNLAVGLLNQAAMADDETLLQPLSERLEAAQGQIERTLAELPDPRHVDPMRMRIEALLELGRGNDGIFSLRRQELTRLAEAEDTVAASHALTAQLGEQVENLVAAARAESHAAAVLSADAIQGGKLFMIVLSAGAVLGAAVVMIYYVGPRIIQPIENITAAMSDLAAGDTSVDIPGRERRDELGRMARALGVFRDTAVEVQASNLREIRETRRRLSDAIESISEAFSLYDDQDRLVVCNSKYRSLLYPGIAEEIKPGMTFEAIVRRAVERGYIEDAKDDPETWLAERLKRHRNPGGAHLQQRGDGRWILVSERRTEDGGTVAVYSDITELKQREQELAEKSNSLEQLSNQLAKYLSPQVYESIFTGRQEVKVASQRKKLTVFFSDIAGFTETADRMESEELTELLNHYLTEMSRIALDHGATIDKYVGDAIVIFFGDPESQGVKADALACVKMAIAMRERMHDLQAEWRDKGIEKPLECRIGISTGFCTVGNFGSEDRMDYTIIGGGVNLASRLESAATPGEILLSYETYALVKDEIACEARGEIAVKGIAYPVATYRVLDSQIPSKTPPSRIEETLPHLKLRIDLDRMGSEERDRTREILSQAMKRLGGKTEPS